MRKIAVVIVVAALFASTAAISVKHQRRWTDKLDARLVQTVQQPPADPINVMIQVHAGTMDRLTSHLVQHGLKPRRVSTADSLTVQMPASMLRSVAGDEDVLHISSDAALGAF